MFINQNLKHCWRDVPEVERGQQHGDACVAILGGTCNWIGSW